MAIIMTRSPQQLHDENEALRKQLNDEKRRSRPRDGDAHLIVNGEVRKIGKKSQYLLDMLTLPEDK